MNDHDGTPQYTDFSPLLTVPATDSIPVPLDTMAPDESGVPPVVYIPPPIPTSMFRVLPLDESSVPLPQAMRLSVSSALRSAWTMFVFPVPGWWMLTIHSVITHALIFALLLAVALLGLLYRTIYLVVVPATRATRDYLILTYLALPVLSSALVFLFWYLQLSLTQVVLLNAVGAELSQNSIQLLPAAGFRLRVAQYVLLAGLLCTLMLVVMPGVGWVIIYYFWMVCMPFVNFTLLREATWTLGRSLSLSATAIKANPRWALLSAVPRAVSPLLFLVPIVGPFCAPALMCVDVVMGAHAFGMVLDDGLGGNISQDGG